MSRRRERGSRLRYCRPIRYTVGVSTMRMVQKSSARLLSVRGIGHQEKDARGMAFRTVRRYLHKFIPFFKGLM